MPDQSNLALLQNAVDLRRQLDKALAQLNAGITGATALASSHAEIQIADNYVQGWAGRDHPITESKDVSFMGLLSDLQSALRDEDGGTAKKEAQNYYVLSGDSPFRICFDEATAKEVGALEGNCYLDVFDAEGKSVSSWMRVGEEGSPTCTWTTNF